MSDRNAPAKIAVIYNDFQLSMVRSLLEDKGIPAVYEPIYGTFVNDLGIASVDGYIVVVPQSVAKQTKEMIEGFLSSDEFVFCEESGIDENNDCDSEYEEAYAKIKKRRLNIYSAIAIVSLALWVLSLLLRNN